MWTLGAYIVVFVIPALCTLFTVGWYLAGKNNNGGGK